MSKLRAIGSDDKWHDVIKCLHCGTPIILEDDVNSCPKKGCDYEVDRNGNMIGEALLTEQQKEDRRYIQMGLDNLWSLTDAEYWRLLKGG
jgi:hypothetical protein